MILFHKRDGGPKKSGPWLRLRAAQSELEPLTAGFYSSYWPLAASLRWLYLWSTSAFLGFPAPFVSMLFSHTFGDRWAFGWVPALSLRYGTKLKSHLWVKFVKAAFERQCDLNCGKCNFLDYSFTS